MSNLIKKLFVTAFILLGCTVIYTEARDYTDEKFEKFSRECVLMLIKRKYA